MNLFEFKPELPPIVLPEKWECPITGLIVPKEPLANLQYRSRLLEVADKDADLQQDLFTASSQSILWWVNTFAFTVRVFEPKDGGGVQQAENVHLPFVTWPHIQDPHILRIEHCIDEGESLLTDKSRDMGATWAHIAVLTHRLLFRPDESHLMISRKEEVVDNLGGLPKGYPHGPLADPGTLFGKIDYILNRLPEWMLPKFNRKKLHLVNQDNGSRIDGESANATAGSSDRRKSIFLDEFAKIEEAEAIKRSTKDVTACRLVCSTPNGPGTTYSKWRTSGTIPVVILPWWEHPEKSKDRYAIQDDVGRWQIRSPWYDQRCKEDSPKEIAIELDMDHVGSGDTFFEGMILEIHKRQFAREPVNHLSIGWKKDTTDTTIQTDITNSSLKHLDKRTGGRHLRIWTELNEEGRPDQTFTYTVGCDIGKGQGASNSVASVMNDQTREKIAEWADANVPPYEFAKTVCALCLWVGGRNKRPLLIWENNGDPGFDFGNQVMQTYRYTPVWFHRQIGTGTDRVGKRYGWRSSPEAKADALGTLRRAYAHGGFINHSREALEEAITYIAYPTGGLGPARLLEESDSTRLAHGDRVIADMLCLVPHAPQFKDRSEERAAHPMFTFAGRMKDWKKTKQQMKSGKMFNFELEEA